MRGGIVVQALFDAACCLCVGGDGRGVIGRGVIVVKRPPLFLGDLKCAGVGCGVAALIDVARWWCVGVFAGLALCLCVCVCVCLRACIVYLFYSLETAC